MTQRPLTGRQAEVLAWIVSHRDLHGYSPTYREIAAHFCVFPGAIAGHVHALVAKGVLIGAPGVARGLVPVA